MIILLRYFQHTQSFHYDYESHGFLDTKGGIHDKFCSSVSMHSSEAKCLPLQQLALRQEHPESLKNQRTVQALNDRNGMIQTYMWILNSPQIILIPLISDQCVCKCKLS